MTHPQYLTAWNQVYFPLLHLHQEKLLVFIVIWVIYFQINYIYLNKKTIENIINIQNKLNPADINNSFIMYKCNEKFIIQSIDFLV